MPGISGYDVCRRIRERISRLKRDLEIPRQMAESEIVDWFKLRAKENGDGYTSFLGAGAYFHYRPVVIDALVQRGEIADAADEIYVAATHGQDRTVATLVTNVWARGQVDYLLADLAEPVTDPNGVLQRPAFNLAGNLLLMSVLVGRAHLPAVTANFCAILVCSSLNFFLSHFWVFRQRPAR